LDSVLRTEAIAFSRYLVGSEPSSALIERYCQANAELFAGDVAPDDAALLDFARRHGWAIPMLDAAMAMTRPESLLRKKLLVMMAILETTPEHVARTEARSVGLPRLAWRLGTAGVTAAFNLAAGLALSVAIRRRDGR
jgi:hypothetical protein